MDYSPWNCEESDTAEVTSMHKGLKEKNHLRICTEQTPRWLPSPVERLHRLQKTRSLSSVEGEKVLAPEDANTVTGSVPRVNSR